MISRYDPMKKFCLATIFIMTLLNGSSLGSYCWIQKSNVGTLNRYASMGFSIGTKAYLAGGWINSVGQTDTWEYDPVTDVWTQKANFPSPGFWAGAGFSINGKGYLSIGFTGSGYPTNTFEYNPVSNTWTAKAPFPANGRQDVYSFAIGNYGYVFGGYRSSSYFNTLYRYDPVSDSWSLHNTLPAVGRDGARGFVIGNTAYICGGFNLGIGAFNEVWAFNSSSNTFSAKSPLPGPARHSLCAFEMNGKGFAGNGRDNIYFNDFYEYDPIGDSWSAIPSFPGLTLGYTVCFTIGNGGYIATGRYSSSTTSNQTWLLSQTPQAAFTVNQNICSLTIQLQNQSTIGQPVLWDFGDGTTSSLLNPTHTYTSSGTYLVTLISGNSPCTDTTSQQITVNQGFNATFTYNTDCNQSITTQSTTAGASNYSWIWGDGSTSIGITSSHTYNQPGVYSIAHVVSGNNCTDTIFQTITIDTVPVSSISLTYSQCHDSVYLNSENTSNSYYWDFGDGQFANTQATSHVYNQSGNYNIVLINQNQNCSDTANIYAEIFDSPIANITSAVSCDGTLTAITFPDNNQWIYTWLTGDGNQYNSSQLSHNYQVSGNYLLELTVSNTYCTIEDSVQINVPDSINYLIFTDVDSCFRKVRFDLITSSSVNVEWHFGDGTTATGTSVNHSYELNIPYTVLVYVIQGSNCTDTSEIYLDLTNTNEANFFIPNVFTPNNDNINDFFEVKSNVCEFENVKIFDRWGLTVFESNISNFRWDGTSNGSLLPQGVYIVLLKAGKKSYQGTISLIR